MRSGLLSLALFIPALGAIAFVILRKQNAVALSMARAASVLSSALLLFGLVEMHQAGAAVAMAFSENISWLSQFAIQYNLALDGLSAPAILLNALLFPILLCSEPESRLRARGYVPLLLIAQFCQIGICLSQDLFLAIFFISITVLPYYFLVSVWGTQHSEGAGFKFLIGSIIGNTCLFLSLLLIFIALPIEGRSFLLKDLSTSGFGWFSFGLFSLGIALRIPLFPLDTLLTPFHRSAPTAVAVSLNCGFVFAALSFYIRTGQMLFSKEILAAQPWIFWIGALNALMGALGAFRQQNLRAFLGNGTQWMIGMTLMGFGSGTLEGLVGALTWHLSAGVGFGVLGILLGWIEIRSKSQTLLGGWSQKAPMLAIFFAIAFMASVGLPGFVGFAGAVLVFFGVSSGTITNSHPLESALAIGSISLAALTMCAAGIRIYQAAFFGGAPDLGNESVVDIRFRDVLCVAPAIIIGIALGVYPKGILDLLVPVATQLLGAASGGGGP